MPALTGKVTTFLRLLCLAVLPAIGMACSPHAATFYEGTRFAFVVEYNAASGEPVNLTLGYKRRIAAVVPPQTPAKDQQSSHQGEALSLVSTFEVEPGGPGIGDGLVIRNIFASGNAANVLTSDDAKQKVDALFAATSIPDLSPDARKRRDVLFARFKTVDNAQAAKILADAQITPTPPRRCVKNKATESRCTLKDVLSTADEATIAKLEPAFEKLP